MARSITCALAAAVAGAALSALGVTGVDASGAATAVPQAAHQGPASGTLPLSIPPGTRLWVERYNSPGNDKDQASSVAVDRRGKTVFVTGSVYGTDSGSATIAYNAATGTQLWVQRNRSFDGVSAVAVDPRGNAVFITGSSFGRTSITDYATVAYNPATGAQLWVQRYNGPGNGINRAMSVAVSPDGETVFVTGTSGVYPDYDYATIAYNAATGARLWVQRYNGPGNLYDYASSVAVGRNGTVFVTGTCYGGASDFDYATIAYNAATGARLWVQRYNGPGNGPDEASSVAVDRKGRTVFVTGYSRGTPAYITGYATVAYNAATGARLWVRRYTGPSFGSAASSVAVGRNGTVFVTGSSYGVALDDDYATVAYNAATGAQLWVRRYNGPGNFIDRASSVAMDQKARTVFVTGSSQGIASSHDYATIAYNAVTGARLWVRRYNGPGNFIDYANAMAVGRNGTVFVTGTSWGGASDNDYATVAYKG